MPAERPFEFRSPRRCRRRSAGRVKRRREPRGTPGGEGHQPEEDLLAEREGYTKADLVAYYETVAPYLLPYLRDRPLVLTRYPDGITGSPSSRRMP